jgi:hypothetical protein
MQGRVLNEVAVKRPLIFLSFWAERSFVANLGNLKKRDSSLHSEWQILVFWAACKSVDSTEIPSNYSRESGGRGFPACADKSLNLKDIILIFFHKEHLEELRVIHVAPACNTQVHRLESLCHQPKMNFARASFDCFLVVNPPLRLDFHGKKLRFEGTWV